MMEMDLVETAKLTRVDTYKCLNFREACIGSREDQTPEPPAHPPSAIPPTSVRKIHASEGNV